MKGIVNWFGANPLRPAILSIFAILAIGSLANMLSPPRMDRNWYPYLSHTPQVEITETSFTVSPVSDWSYEFDRETDTTYLPSASYNFDELHRVWFMLEPQPGSQLAAHTLLLFEFSDDRILGLTIEARREQGEEYSAFHGQFNAFELIYIWATARDLLVRRATMLDHEVFVYPVDITEAQSRTLLVHLLERSQSLSHTPRYYNTVMSNCTNELAKAAGFHWAPAYILTGRSDEYLFRRGILPGPSFEEAHTRSDMTTFIQALNQAPHASFDRELLAELRRRNDGSYAPPSERP
ncbi:MAG: DUF4105 domain-containing protein [Caulobacteraceae bacterium]|nr:DUF4105 domain-containing protein [Caulobacteraceae bacterium]